MNRPSLSQRVSSMNGWFKILLVALPLLIAGLVAFGSLRSDVVHTDARLDRAEQRWETRLNRIEDKVDRLLDRMP